MTCFRLIIVVVAVALAAQPLSVRADAAQKVAAKDVAAKNRAAQLFTLKVLPLLKSKCFACHGENAKDIKGNFDIRTRGGATKGGESGEAAIVAGQPEKSPLYLSVKWQGLEMPPKQNDRLNAQQIEWIRLWIAAGAVWPDEEQQREIRKTEWSRPETKDGVLVRTSGGQSDEWTYRRYKPADLWSFRPVRRVEPPKIAAAPHPIDAFIRRRLNTAGFAPASRADKSNLIRRATFDLLGLPPTPRQIENFVNDKAPDAWEKLIDRLLASPRYGERWAQHWLDVARYADTGGMANDFERSNMWRYRDYVIRSFNADKPYDRFVVEQLAGDQLADASMKRRLAGNAAKVAAVRKSGNYSEEEAEWIVASSFLRMGAWDNAMIKSPQARQIYLDDVVNAVGQTFLATTMRCCKCHDHKFDPLPTRDYYRFYAAFAGTQMAERPLRFLPGENRDGFAEGKAFVEKMLRFATTEKTKIEAKREAAARKWYAEHRLPYKGPGARNNDPDDKKPPRNVGLTHVDEGRLKVRDQAEWIWRRALERYQPMVNGVYDGSDVRLAWNGARKLRMPAKLKQNWKPDSRILMGGALEAPGDKVRPGVLAAVGVPVEGTTADQHVLPEDITRRRIGFAKWVTDPRNPLTTRAIVNRVWQYHFGKPIAGNPNNFGAKGAKPTHPELLDWLAANLVDHGWKLKRLHKLIMTSQAYQMRNRHPQHDRLRQIDPNNHLLAFFPTRRLTAEEIRDAMLSISGELNPAMGGLPVMPEMNLEVAFQPRMIQFSLAPAYQPSRTPRERNRRSIYAYRGRGLPDPFLEVFNQPNPNDSCELRDTAAVSPQAFTLLNSDLMTDRSIALALRVEREAKSLDAQVNRAFQLIFGRLPTAIESTRLNKYVKKMQAYHRGTKPQPVKYPTRIKRSLVEEFSGREFEFVEILPVFENYVPDAKPATVSAQTRALADLCLLLLNSNEFLYLY